MGPLGKYCLSLQGQRPSGLEKCLSTLSHLPDIYMSVRQGDPGAEKHPEMPQGSSVTTGV